MSIDKQEVSNSLKDFNKKVINTVGIVSISLLLLLMLLHGFRVILLILAGVLVSAFFLGMGNFIESKTPLKHNASLAVSVVMSIIVSIGIAFALAPHVSEQIRSLQKQLPKAAEKTIDDFKNTKFGGLIVERAENMQLDADKGQITSFFGSLFGTLSTIYIILFLGLFFMVAPTVYLNGVVKLFPINRRERTREILLAMGNTLKNWLLGKLLSMFIVGILTGIGLIALGMPLALTLALFAAIISFIPNFGPIIALVPAFLLAFTQSPLMALYVVILYVSIQAIESNVLTPLIQKKMISLPMAMVLIAQILLGLFTGVLGIILAVPLMAICIVFIRMAYIEDVLGDTSMEDNLEDTSNC